MLYRRAPGQLAPIVRLLSFKCRLAAHLEFCHKPTAVEDPRILVEQFRHAAFNAKKAGFDGVERRTFPNNEWIRVELFS